MSALIPMVFSRTSLRQWLRAFILAVFVAGFAMGQEARDQEPRDVEVQLLRGKATFRLYPSQLEQPRAIMIFGSGDGGWTDWEDVVCEWLCQSGVICAGVNLREYAETDYNQATIGADMATITIATMKESKQTELPVFYGGWS
ncbi:MAG: hypothetical protein JWO08_261, partial [Verrucomicrobiaceae bacterium]|nr:hypothetical protein [Verrucomicrobiaceae bacterium]